MGHANIAWPTFYFTEGPYGHRMSEYYSLKCTRLTGEVDEKGTLKQCDGHIEHGFGAGKTLCPKCGHRTMRKIVKVTAESAVPNKD